MALRSRSRTATATSGPGRAPASDGRARHRRRPARHASAEELRRRARSLFAEHAVQAEESGTGPPETAEKPRPGPHPAPPTRPGRPAPSWAAPDPDRTGRPADEPHAPPSGPHRSEAGPGPAGHHLTSPAAVMGAGSTPTGGESAFAGPGERVAAQRQASPPASDVMGPVASDLMGSPASDVMGPVAAGATTPTAVAAVGLDTVRAASPATAAATRRAAARRVISSGAVHAGRTGVVHAGPAGVADMGRSAVVGATPAVGSKAGSAEPVDAGPAGGADTGRARAVPDWRGRVAGAVRERMPLWLQARCGLERRNVVALTALLAVAAILAAQHFWTGRAQTVQAPDVVRAVAPRQGQAEDRGSTAAAPVTSVGAPAPAGTEIVVDVSGKVRHPGIQRLPAGSRVADALRAAGGVLPGTDTDGLNRARFLVDGEQVVVGGPPPAENPAPPGTSAAGAAGAGTAGAPTAPVSLNTATAEQLQTLPGVGPVLARRIIDYRTQHGGFRSVDQLREVSGIGERRFADLRSLVGP